MLLIYIQKLLRFNISTIAFDTIVELILRFLKCEYTNIK